MLNNQTFLITGIADENSLAMKVAEKVLENNGKVVCTGLGLTPFHKNVSEKAKDFLNKNYDDFQNACQKVLGKDIYTAPLDVTNPEPMSKNSPLLELSSVCVLPHIGSATIEARTGMAKIAAENIIAFSKGEKIPYCVNPEVYSGDF
jgi:enoyl-[acyl-carrier-protein] reductase (NADH)